jgi:hypothetical protein
VETETKTTETVGEKKPEETPWGLGSNVKSVILAIDLDTSG